jgi:predicted nucleic acid-binding protein
MVLVDSSVWIEALRREGDPRVKIALENLLEAYDAWWSSVVRLEVLGAARARERKALEYFFDVIPYCEVDARTWDTAQALSWRLRDKGHTLPWNDILTAALALEKNARVFARDAHFDVLHRILGLRLYKPGYGGRYEAER